MVAITSPTTVRPSTVRPSTVRPSTVRPTTVRPTRPVPRRHLELVGARATESTATAVLRRLLPVAVAVAALVAVVVLALSPSSGASVDGIPVDGRTHVVAAGETMWSIASELAPAGEAAVYVERLVAVNGGASVTPGQVLTLPAG